MLGGITTEANASTGLKVRIPFDQQSFLSIPDLNTRVLVSSGNKPSLVGETTPMFWRY